MMYGLVKMYIYTHAVAHACIIAAGDRHESERRGSGTRLRSPRPSYRVSLLQQDSRMRRGTLEHTLSVRRWMGHGEPRGRFRLRR
jgi:hypothetical protein